jgi:uncharacterized protein (TIGR03435 family)
MRRTLAGAGFIALLLTVAPDAALCQPSFEIADVHVSPRSDWVKNQTHPMQGGYLSGDRYEVRRATLLDLIKTAYNVEADKIYGGPSWLDYDRFEIVAKAKPGTSAETLRLMLQTLLAERFGLVVKPETQPAPGYTLSKGKGELKLKEGGTIGDIGCRNGVSFSMGAAGRGAGQVSIHCHDASMQSFVATLSKALSSPVGNFPVVDSTSIEGMWDVDIQYEEPPGGPSASGPVLAGELGKLGLLLELGKVPQPVLTVERANEQPSANSPGVEAALPARPQPEFEVATVRLAGSESGGSRPLMFQAGGRITASGYPPAILIQQAWNLSSYEQIVGLPKSFSGSGVSKNVSIVAKAPQGWFPEAPGAANGQAREMLNAMLRTLLIDRYKMTFHFEDRPTDALTLTANKPKLTKADPANRTGCKREGQEQQARVLNVKLVCRNMTMQQFAEQMPGLDSGIWYPVQDSTGLEGAWDFTLNFDAMSRLGTFGGPPVTPAAAGAGVTAEASDPSGVLSFVDAVQKQLGLKVETHKRPEKVLVIDHMLEDPVEN